ncbi:MAG: AAA family ATPase [Mycoplasmatales bacterium]
MTKKAIPIGIEDYQDLVNNKYLYVDKTLLIQEIIDNGEKVLFLPRPRRFGKTLNLSMLRYFFDIKLDTKELFKNSKLFQTKDNIKYYKYLNKYPVININLKGLEAKTYEEMIERLKLKIRDLILQNQQILDENKILLSDWDILNKIKSGNFGELEVTVSLKALSSALFTYYGQKCIMLIDEYDNIVSYAYEQGYYEQVITLYRNLFGEALKTNEALEIGVMTGILRISKENLFSGLNNLKVRTILEEDYATYFGFIEAEVECLLQSVQMEDKFLEVKQWYNGYNFSNNIIYNPWSVLNFIANKGKAEAYWLNTSSNIILYNILKNHTIDGPVFKKIEQLTVGKKIAEEIQTNITYSKLEADVNLWSILLLSGYLKVVKKIDRDYYELAIPNEEVKEIYKKTIRNYFMENYEVTNSTLRSVYRGFIINDIRMIKQGIEEVLQNMSVRDKREDFYHGVMLTLLSTATNHQVLSNVESGKGYLDLCLYPIHNSELGIIIELKRAKESKDIAKLIKVGVNQIEAKEYETLLKGSQAQEIHKYIMVFHDKEVVIKQL